MLKIRLLRNLDIRTLLCIFRLMFIQRAMTSCNGRTNPKTLMTVYEYKDTTTVIPSPKLALGKIQQYVGQDKIEKNLLSQMASVRNSLYPWCCHLLWRLGVPQQAPENC